MFDWSSVQRVGKGRRTPKKWVKILLLFGMVGGMATATILSGFFFPKIPSLIFPGTTTVKTLFFFFFFSKSAVAQLFHLRKWPTELKRKKMTSEDLAERSTKSLCFRCNEKCGHRHVCKTLFMMRRRNGDRKIRRRSKRTISSSNFTPRMI